MNKNTYKTNKDIYTVGDTIKVTIFNTYKYEEQYDNWDDSCFFSNKLYSFDVGTSFKCKRNFDFIKLPIGNSVTFSYIVPQKDTYYFIFSMFSEREIAKSKGYHCLTLKFEIID